MKERTSTAGPPPASIRLIASSLQVDGRPLAAQARGRAAADPVGDHRPAGARAARCRRERPHAPAHGPAARRAHHRAWPRARRGRQGRAQRPGRDLAVQRGRPLPPSGRPARRAARSQFLRRWPRARRRRGQLQIHHHKARRLSVGQPQERLAAGAYPFLAVWAGLRHAPDHPDVFPQRPGARLRPDLQFSARRRAPSPAGGLRHGGHAAGLGAGLQVRHRAARPQRHADGGQACLA